MKIFNKIIFLNYNKKRMPLYIISMALAAFLLALIMAHISKPEMNIDAISLGLLGMLIVVSLLPFADAIKVPGVLEVSLREIEETKEIVDSSIHPDLDKSPSRETAIDKLKKELDNLAESQPRQAVIQLIGEIGDRIRYLYSNPPAGKVVMYLPNREVPALIIVLGKSSILTNEESRITMQVYILCKNASESTDLSSIKAKSLIDVGLPIIKMLEMKVETKDREP